MRIHTTATYSDVMSAISAMNRALKMANDSAGENGVHEYRAKSAKPRDFITPVSGDASEHRSQTHLRAFEIKLSGDSSRGPNSGRYGMDNYGDKAATRDQWGMFLSALFEVDPAARVGGAKNPIYIDRDHFHWSTGNRYAGTPDDNGVRRIDAPTGTFLTAGKGYHRRHEWTLGGSSATGAYYVSECACGAIVRRVAYGRSWSEISA